jgi:hypothetical protein
VVTTLKNKQSAQLLVLLRKIGKEQGLMFNAFEIREEGVHLYYNGKKYGPFQGISASEEVIRNQIAKIQEYDF